MGIKAVLQLTEKHGPPCLRFCLERHEVERLLEEKATTIEALLVQLIQPASLMARPPISSYHVGWA